MIQEGIFLINQGRDIEIKNKPGQLFAGTIDAVHMRLHGRNSRSGEGKDRSRRGASPKLLPQRDLILVPLL